jgi:hypothetical protein
MDFKRLDNFIIEARSDGEHEYSLELIVRLDAKPEEDHPGLFFVEPQEEADVLHALFILSYYRVRFKIYPNERSKMGFGFKVHVEDREFDLRMCEIAFQASFHQKNDRGIMTFTEVI